MTLPRAGTAVEGEAGGGVGTRMISLCIQPRDIAGHWRFAEGAWRSGSSFVAPFAHPILQTLMVEAPEARLILVREDPAGSGRGHHPTLSADLPAAEVLDRLAAWPFNIQLVVLPRDGATVTVATGRGATAPLFLTSTDGVLAADWDVAALYPRLSGDFDLGRTAYALSWLALPYGSATIFPNVLHLTERASVHWDAAEGRLSVDYPRPLRRHVPRRLHADADPVAAFDKLFASILRRAVGNHEGAIATEVSGGLDSGVATLVAADALGVARVKSFGLLLPGPQMPSQAARREALTALAGVSDTAILARPPYSSPEIADDPIVPWGEYYREAFRALGEAMVGQGCSILVRGIGGDEISELTSSEAATAPPRASAEEEECAEMPDYLTDEARKAVHDAEGRLVPAPPAHAAPSFYSGAAASAPVYMRRGIWPIYPYGAPELVAFCRSLPQSWREDRRLQRALLARRGLPDWVVRPDPSESFLPLRDGLFEPPQSDHVRALFTEPVLAELGLVDGPRLRAAFERAIAEPEAPGRTQIMEAAGLETLARTWRRPASPMGP
ncbi:MAG: hypothetical protein QOH04_1644 [Sphingomonadales bacterium]|nr:hypothetical protein [Sphingomonadales bacterium]